MVQVSHTASGRGGRLLACPASSLAGSLNTSLSRSSLPLWGGSTLSVREATDHAFVNQELWAAIGVVEEFDCYTEDAADETSAGTARARRTAFHRAVSGSTKTDQGCSNVEVS
jgi:hypothetical protein